MLKRVIRGFCPDFAQIRRCLLDIVSPARLADHPLFFGIVMQLTEAEWHALRALGDISDGNVTFMNVVDADALVAKGLAERFGLGQFVLTDQGRALLARD